MKENYIKYKGVIYFDPINKTKKHENQSNWKRMALITFDGEIAEYYAWFLQNRFNIKLNRPLRGSHISFINDSVNDMRNGLQCTGQGIEALWSNVKKKWDGKEIEVVLDIGTEIGRMSDGKHWWLNIPQEERGFLHSIRAELGLSRPHWGLHMSLGYANNKNIEHSKYILECVKKDFIN